MVPGRLGSVQGHHHPERERVSAIQWLSGEERARSHGVGALGQSPRGEVTLRRDIQMGVLAHVVGVDVAGAGDLPPVAVGRLLRDPESHGVPDPPNEAALLDWFQKGLRSDTVRAAQDMYLSTHRVARYGILD